VVTSRLAIFRQWSPLQVALGVSIAAHAALLAVRFADPQRLERVFRDSPLEVILVNASSDGRPEQAAAIAQANLAGGSEAPDQRRATSPLPPSMVARVGDALTEDERRLEALKQRQNQLLAQVRHELARLAAVDEVADTDAQARQQREARRQTLVKMLVEIERRIEEENARPRKRYVSPATREEVYAIYYDAMRRKIEERGTAQFPEAGGRKLYGELTMAITVNHTGQVLNTEVVRPSNSRLLDTRAQAIVRSLSFDRFSEAMRRRADQIVVVSRFRFTREGGLQTQMSAMP
jgi:protein TonB